MGSKKVSDGEGKRLFWVSAAVLCAIQDKRLQNKNKRKEDMNVLHQKSERSMWKESSLFDVPALPNGLQSTFCLLTDTQARIQRF